MRLSLAFHRQGLKVLHWGLHVQGLVGSDVVVEVLVLGELRAHFVKGQPSGVESPELRSRRVVGLFDAPVAFGAFGGQDEQWDARLAAGLLEVPPELGAAVHLDGLDGERQVGEHFGEEPLGVAGGGAGVGPGHHHFSEGAQGPELLDLRSGEVQGHVVDLHEFARRLGLHAGAPALGVAVEASPLLGLDAPAAEGAGPDAPQADALGQDAPDSRLAQGRPLAGQHDAHLGPAHEGEAPAHVPDRRLVPAPAEQGAPRCKPPLAGPAASSLRIGRRRSVAVPDAAGRGLTGSGGEMLHCATERRRSRTASPRPCGYRKR